jgi:hypothetical protein
VKTFSHNLIHTSDMTSVSAFLAFVSAQNHIMLVLIFTEQTFTCHVTKKRSFSGMCSKMIVHFMPFCEGFMITRATLPMAAVCGL